MIKYSIVVLVFMFSNSLIGQTDSLTIKLKYLKSLKDSSLISEVEYEQMKLKELGLSPNTSLVKKSPEVEKLRKKIQGKIVGASIGSIFFATGFYGTIYVKNKTIVPEFDVNGNFDQKAYDFQVRAKKNNTIMLGAFTGLMGVFTVVNLVTLQSTSDKLKKAKQTVSLNIKENGFTVAYHF